MHYEMLFVISVHKNLQVKYLIFLQTI